MIFQKKPILLTTTSNLPRIAIRLVNSWSEDNLERNVLSCMLALRYLQTIIFMSPILSSWIMKYLINTCPNITLARPILYLLSVMSDRYINKKRIKSFILQVRIKFLLDRLWKDWKGSILARNVRIMGQEWWRKYNFLRRMEVCSIKCGYGTLSTK